MRKIESIRRLAAVSVVSALVLFWIPFLCIRAGAADSGENILENARKGVVRILAVYESGESLALSLGSGFVLGTSEDGAEYFATNYHVVGADEDGNMPMAIYILLSNQAVTATDGLNEEYVLSCQMVETDISTRASGYPDYAILKSEETVPGSIALPLARRSDIQDGDVLYALGFPADADAIAGTYYAAEPNSVTVTQGGFSRMIDDYQGGRYEMIQHQAEINHGNSGGPLLTASGAVVGINTYGFSSDERTLFASVSIDYVRDACDKRGIPYTPYTPDTAHSTQRHFPVLFAVVGIVLVGGGISWFTVSHKGEKKGAIRSALKLQGTEGFFQGRTFAFSKSKYLLGTAKSCKLQYPEGTLGIDPVHCELQIHEGSIYITDKNTQYGTYVNEYKLQPQSKYQLQEGDEISLGSTHQVFKVVK